MFDFLVVGAGSGGLAAARKAAKQYGKRVALIEASNLLGGTCVNRGCVPKKIMYNASSLLEGLQKDAKAYSIEGEGKFNLNWSKLVGDRDAYLQKLNGIYSENLEKDGVKLIDGSASFKSASTLQIDRGNQIEEVSAPHILIATGSHALIPDNVPGVQLGITSDGFFQIRNHPPRKVAIVGSGYVGVELAGILHTLGSDVTLWCRKEGVLSHFDAMISTTVTEEMRRIGITINSMSSINEIKKSDSGDGGLTVCFNQSNTFKECYGYDCLIWAVGRAPTIDGLGLERVGVKVDEKKHNIVTDIYQNTTVKGIYALGDVDARMPLTPVAIAAARHLVDRLFGGEPQAHLEYSLIPTVVFSHPEPCGSIGISEKEARDRHGASNVKVYESKFVNLYYALHPSEDKAMTRYKMVCVGPEERIVGLHLIGKSSDEILQGFAVAIKMGATKKDFDNCVAIHPTAAEELVTMK